jgi:hypothetical protein
MAAGRVSPPGAWKGHMEMRPATGGGKKATAPPVEVAGCPRHGPRHALPPRRRRPPRTPLPLLGLEEGGPRRDDGGGTDKRGGADGRGGVAARAVEEVEDPGPEVDPGCMP